MRFFRPGVQRIINLVVACAAVCALVLPVTWAYRQAREAHLWRETACAYRLRMGLLVAAAGAGTRATQVRSAAAANPPASSYLSVNEDDFRTVLARMHGRLLTLDDTVEFFNLVLGTQMTADEKQDLVAFLRTL